jgi:hypothetical protein
MMRTLFYYAFILFCISSCTSPSEPHEEAADVVLANSVAWQEKVMTKNEILSTHLGQEITDFIAQNSPATIVEGEEYSLDGHLENGMAFSFFVSADHGKVYEMNLDLFPDSSQHEKVFHDILTQMDSLYKPSHPADGYATWRRASSKGKLVEVTLADISLEMGRPSIMINHLEHEDRIFED